MLIERCCHALVNRARHADVLLQGLDVEDGHPRIECSDYGTHGFDHLLGFGRRTRDQNHVRAIVPAAGQIENG